MVEVKRNYYIDIAKGIAIFLMLWGHCIQCCIGGSGLDFFENGVFKIIYSFHMPLFMLISGYMFFGSFSKRNLGDLLVHRTQSLLQPIVFCSFFNFLITTGLLEVLSGYYGAPFEGNWMRELPSLWFLWSVLGASIAVAIICKKCDNLILQIILLILIIPAVAFLPNLTLNIYMYPYFILGFYYGKYKDRLPLAVQKLKYSTLVMFPVLVCFYEKKHYIYTTGLLSSGDYRFPEMIAIDVYRWAIGLVGSIFVLTVLEMLYRRIVMQSQKPKLFDALSKLGKNSLQIYVFSTAFLSFYLPILFSKMLTLLGIENIFSKNEFVYNFLFTLPLAVVYSIGLYYIVKGFEKIKVSRIMFGK